MAERKERRSSVQRRVRGIRRGARNAMTLIRDGRLGAPYSAGYDEFYTDRTFTLRHYTASPQAPLDREDDADAAGAGGERDAEAPVEAIKQPIVLVPPLMVSSEVYDISPEVSSVQFLTAAGADVWLVDFGVPEDIEGGLERTLDDHILAVDKAVTMVAEHTGEDVHLAGYSQGGMFCYQAAAYRRGEALASVITFGSPVDVRKVIPVPMPGDVATRLLAGAKRAVQKPLDDLTGLPGFLTGTGFKLLGAKKEVQQVVQFFGLLHDREALEKREPKRRFLNGEGFVAWPAPALRRFLDEVVVKNHMTTGGLVVDRKPVTLADIECPILYFIGGKDEIARPRSVRAITKSAPKAPHSEVWIQAGHFGIVVGSRALNRTWPCVVDWMAWHSGQGERPEILDEAGDARDRRREAARAVQDEGGEEEGAISIAYDAATDVLDSVWSRLGDMTLGVSEVLDGMRWQLPRLARLQRLRDSSLVSPARALQEQADAIPDSDFFLWGEKAWTWAEANARVNRYVNALLAAHIGTGDHVAVLMDNHPDYLTVVCALNRMGAVSVLLNSGARGASLRHALEVAPSCALVVDAAHAEDASLHFDGPLLLAGSERSGVEAIKQLETLAPESAVTLPDTLRANNGRGEDVAMLMFTSGTTGLPKAAKITNRRWAMAALGAAAACRLTDRDTVYCSLPLYHATGLLVGCGGALVGGSRLALAPKFSTRTFWNDVRRYGVTVVVYVGEVCRYLCNAPESADERHHPVRVFAGNGMREQVWRQLLERFGDVRVLEFYGSTEGNVALVNLTGEKIGSVGREMTEDTLVDLLRCDPVSGVVERDSEGRCISTAPGEPGLLVSRISESHPLARFDGYTDNDSTAKKVLRDVFEDGDAWFDTGDLMRRDDEGDYWFVDRIGDTFRWKGENVSTEQVEAVLQALDGIDFAAVYGVSLPGREGRAGMAAVQLADGASFDGEAIGAEVVDHLFPAARPLFIRVMEELPSTSTFKLTRHQLKIAGADPATIADALYVLDDVTGAYIPLTSERYARATEWL